MTDSFWPFEMISACKTRPTSIGSGAYMNLFAPGKEDYRLHEIKLQIIEKKG